MRYRKVLTGTYLRLADEIGHPMMLARGDQRVVQEPEMHS